MRYLRLIPFLLLWPLALCVRAQPPGPLTLDKVARTATTNLGHSESSVPLFYYDGKHQVVGYSRDLMLEVVERVRRELKLPALAVKLVPVTAQKADLSIFR